MQTHVPVFILIMWLQQISLLTLLGFLEISSQNYFPEAWVGHLNQIIKKPWNNKEINSIV